MSLESLNRRIKTTTDIGDIVHTMKMLSSASLGQYERALQSLTQYKKTIFDAFHGLFSQESFHYDFPNSKQKDARPLAILIGSNNGLVGRFNNDLMSYTNKYFQKDEGNLRPYVITVGKRMALLAEAQKLDVLASYPIPNNLKEVAPMAAQLLNQVEQILSEHKVDFVYLFANKRKDNTLFTPRVHQLIPLSEQHMRQLKKERWSGRTLPLVTADPQSLFSALVREYLIVLLLHEMVASLASEHFTRMMHMQEAEKNIEETLEEFNLEYQQLRQTQVTDELIDIVSGAEEMNKQKTQSPLDFIKKKK